MSSKVNTISRIEWWTNGKVLELTSWIHISKQWDEDEQEIRSNSWSLLKPMSVERR